jgi:flagellar protein FliO/FliZ
MIKLIPLSRAAATAASALGACLAAFACPGSASAKGKAVSAGENTLLNLNSSPSGAHVGSGGASIVRTVVGLAIVIAVIWGLSWILRQVKSGRDPQVSSAGLASISALTLSTGRSVHLVRAGNEYVLLASAEHGVVPIHRYSEDQAREAGLLPGDEPPPRSRGSLLVARATRTPEHGRHDPMRMPSPGSGILGRVRELTVRR